MGRRKMMAATAAVAMLASMVSFTAPAMAAESAQTQVAAANATTDASGVSADAGYLWLNFKYEDDREARYAYSPDGYNWELLNDGNPIFSSQVGSTGLRDPHIMRLQQPDDEGNKYVAITTDLHGKGPGAAWTGSKNLVVAKSKDLVTWSSPYLLYTGLDNATTSWAPEAIWDPETNDYLVYWSSAGYEPGKDIQKVYKAHTKDFTTLENPTLWISEDPYGGVLDTTIVKGDDGDYYRFTTSNVGPDYPDNSRWFTIIDVSPSLEAEKWIRLFERDAAVNDDGTSKITGDKVRKSDESGIVNQEGETVYQLPDGRWMNMADRSGYHGHVIDKLSDLKNGGSFTGVDTPGSKDIKHGTVMRLTAAERSAVLKAYAKIPVDTVDIAGEGVVNGKASLKTGESMQLSAVVTPDYAMDSTAVWTVDGDAVTVDADGLVRAVKEGVAKVTATVDGKSATVEVTVAKADEQKPSQPGQQPGDHKPGDQKPAVKPGDGQAAGGQQPGGELSQTGGAVAGIAGAIVLLAAAGAGIVAARRRRA